MLKRSYWVGRCVCWSSCKWGCFFWCVRRLYFRVCCWWVRSDMRFCSWFFCEGWSRARVFWVVEWWLGCWCVFWFGGYARWPCEFCGGVWVVWGVGGFVGWCFDGVSLNCLGCRCDIDGCWILCFRRCYCD